jgi:nitroreductase
MKFEEVLRGRRSVRRYEKKPVPKELIIDLIAAAELAPSAGNLRARKYFVVTRPEMRKALAIASYGQRPVETAPVLLVVAADVKRSSSRYGDRGSLFSLQDAAAATMCLLLAAHNLGLGACWIGAFDDELAKEALGLEEHILPQAIVSLGWPAEEPRPPPQRELGEMLFWIE